MIKKTLTKKKLQGLKTKKRIYDTAMKLFIEKGYKNVSVDEIVEAANSSKGGFYTHFKSKINILDDRIKESDIYYKDYYEKELKNSKEDSLIKIKKFVVFTHNILITLFPFNLFQEVISNSLDTSSGIDIKMTEDRQYYKILEEIINQGKDNNEISKLIETDKIISWITAVHRGAIYNYCIKEEIGDHLNFIEELVELAINKIKNNNF